MCKISIVIPAYNAEKVIGRMLDSICRQSFQDWQAVLIDDGSQDATGAILDQYAAMDKRFTVIHQPNGGVSSARNAGMECACGQYLYFADADDELDVDCLALLYRAASKTQADLTTCGFRYVNSFGDTLGTWLPTKQESVNDYCVDWIKRYGINTLCNKLLVRSLVKTQFDTEHAMGEDLKFVCDYLGDVQKIAIIERPLYIYYSENAGSLTKNSLLKMEAIMYDIRNLASFACEQQIPTCLVVNRFFEQVWIILFACQSKSDLGGALEALILIEGLMEFSKENKPLGFKCHLIRILLNNRCTSILYCVAELKRHLDGIIHRLKGFVHEKQQIVGV